MLNVYLKRRRRKKGETEKRLPGEKSIYLVQTPMKMPGSKRRS